MNIRVLVPIANGTEEIEVVTIVDILRRAGAEVCLAGLNSPVTCSRGIQIIPDLLIENEIDGGDYNAVVLSGGLKGVQNFIQNRFLKKLLLNNKNDSIIGAICAAPLVLKEFGILSKDSIITSHPSIKKQFDEFIYVNEKYVFTDNILTGTGVGTAIDFSLKLVELLFDKSTSDKIAIDIDYKR